MDDFSILVIDDDALIPSLITGALKGIKTPFDISFAANGYDGMDKVASKKFSVVFVDINLPGISGYEVVCAIRLSPLNANTQICVISADGPEGVNSDLLPEGTMVLGKPLPYEYLQEFVSSLTS